MGILRGALNGLGKGLQQKAALDWEQMKQDADIAARERLSSLEREHRTELQGVADKNADVRLKTELQARASEGAADRTSREKISSEGNAAAISAAQARAAGRGGSKLIGYDDEGKPIYGADGDGDFKSVLVDELVTKVESGPDGTMHRVPVLDGEGKPIMRKRLVKFSSKTGADYQDDDGVEIDDETLSKLVRPPGAKTDPAASTPGPAAAAPPSAGGVLSQAKKTPGLRGTDPVRDAIALDEQITSTAEVMRTPGLDEKSRAALQKSLSDLIKQKNAALAARGY